jgi:outer membrane protein, multidrug efflux system
MSRRALAVFVVALAGCAGVRKDPPQEAAVQAPSAWRAPARDGNSPSASWWTAFGDSTLDDLVSEALSHNDDIALAATRVEQARAQFHFAHAQRLPSVGLEVVGGRERTVNPGFGVPEEQTAGQGVVEATFDMDLFGKLKASSQAARSGLLASEYARDTVRLSVAASVTSGYLTLRSLDARMEILNKTVEIRRHEVHVEERRYGEGYSSQLELTQAQAELAATEELIPGIELAIARAEDGISILAGRAPGTIARGQAFDTLVLPEIPVSLPATILRDRPDLAAAEAQLAATDHALDAARAAFLPDIQLAVSGGTIGSTLVDSSPVGIWSLGGSILAPIFEAGRLEAQQDAATARRNEAAFAYRKQALQAFREVEDDLAAVAHDAKEDEALTRERDVLQRSLKISTQRYREGYSNYLDQLDAQRNLLSVELRLAQSRSDRLNAAVSLFQALGGGWSPEHERVAHSEP